MERTSSKTGGSGLRSAHLSGRAPRSGRCQRPRRARSPRTSSRGPAQPPRGRHSRSGSRPTEPDPGEPQRKPRERARPLLAFGAGPPRAPAPRSGSSRGFRSAGTGRPPFATSWPGDRQGRRARGSGVHEPGQVRLGLGELRLHGAHGSTELRGDVGFGQIQVVPQDDDGPLAGR
jgi:hypothetical protein